MAKRRSNGEGNIRKRKDGRWEGRYTAGHDPVTGKQVFKNVLGKCNSRSDLKAAIFSMVSLPIIMCYQAYDTICKI